MWKFAFPFLAALLTVGLAQAPGGVTDISANADGVQDALKFAMKEYNKGSNDQYLFKVVVVIKVQGQVVEGYKYFLTVKIAKTMCRKNANVSRCPVITKPTMAQTYQCTFVVWSRPWLNDLQLLEQKCYKINPQ